MSNPFLILRTWGCGISSTSSNGVVTQCYRWHLFYGFPFVVRFYWDWFRLRASWGTRAGAENRRAHSERVPSPNTGAAQGPGGCDRWEFVFLSFLTNCLHFLEKGNILQGSGSVHDTCTHMFYSSYLILMWCVLSVLNLPVQTWRT